MQVFDYQKPATLKEASEALIKAGTEASMLNGGTDLIVRMRDGVSKPKTVIDLKAIGELHGISESGGCVYIGACETMNDIATNDVISQKIRFLGEACHSVGSFSVRNRATMAGNICNASPLADTATPLLALDAKVSVYSPEGDKTISIHEFFTGVRKTCLKSGEIVKNIIVPIPSESVGSFQKYSRRSEVDLSTVCATVACVDGSIRVAYGSVAPTPIRLKKTEEFLNGEGVMSLKDKAKIEEVIAKAQEIAAEEVSPIGDIRASKEYRLDIVKVLLGRGIRNLLGMEEE